MSKSNSYSISAVKTAEQVSSINDFVREHQIAFRDCMLSALLTRHAKGVNTPLNDDDIYFLYELHQLIKSAGQPEAMAFAIEALQKKFNGFKLCHYLKEVFNKVIRWEARNHGDGIFITEFNLNTVELLMRLFDAISMEENPINQ